MSGNYIHLYVLGHMENKGMFLFDFKLQDHF
jgi:hypothetical protein